MVHLLFDLLLLKHLVVVFVLHVALYLLKSWFEAETFLKIIESRVFETTVTDQVV